MAKASVKLICAKCGAEFKKEKYCTNRSAANSWEEWAKENFELCPDCEKEAYRKAQKEKGLLVSFELNRKATREKGVGVINACFSGDTYSRKADLKKFGCVWDGYDWVISIPYSEYEVWRERIVSELEATIEEEVPEIVLQKAKRRIEKDTELYTEYEKEQAEKMAEIGEIPSFPAEFVEIRSGKQWNGKIYGGKQKSVYLDGEKVEISSELATEIEKAMILREKWREKRDSFSVSFSDWKENRRR